MSSRKQHKHQVHRPAAPPARPSPPPRPARRLYAGIATGLLLGVLVGAITGAAFFFGRRTTIDLGMIGAPATGPATAQVPDAALFATYAGSASCRECHAKACDAWATSHHALAERAPDPALDKPAFDPPRGFDHGSQKTEIRATAAGQFEIATPGPDAKSAAFPVARVIGVDPLRQFLTPFPGGRFQTLEAAYDPRKDQWFNVYGAEDRKPGEWGHWTGRGMNWNAQCAACHNTRVRKNYDEKSDAYQTAMAERTVSCESCHGPMKAHVLSARSSSPPPHPPASPSRLTKDQTEQTCAACHARRGDLTGEFAPGDSFHDHYALDIPDLSEDFFPDGQVKEEDYEFTAFLGSKMHAAGVRCADCHDPHTAKTLLPGNNLCMRCHNGSFKGSPVIVPEQHSFHQAESPGNQCVNCHMPQTTFMQRHARHDHGFTTPDPVLTKEFNVPNACNRCHTDKDVDWAVAAVDARYGPKMNRPTRDRARLIAKARRGDESAREPLVKTLNGEKHPFWRAVAAAVLSQWAAEPGVLAALTAATDHADPLVREHATHALAPLAARGFPGVRKAVERRLADPARAVRVQAAWALRESLDPRSPAAQDLLAQLTYNADQPAGAMQQGLYHLARGALDPAAAYFSKAIAWNPTMAAPAHDALATVLSRQGRTADAIDHLGRAARLDPRDAEYPYKLALGYAELGQLDVTIDYLRQAIKLNPRHARASYNLGLAYDRSGKPAEAIATLRQAEALDPADAQIPYARARIHAKSGQPDEARQAARTALQLNPNHDEAAALLNRLGG